MRGDFAYFVIDIHWCSMAYYLERSGSFFEYDWIALSFEDLVSFLGLVPSFKLDYLTKAKVSADSACTEMTLENFIASVSS